MDNKITFAIKITLCAENKFFGPGTVTLLQNVEEAHSLSAASKKMSLSYSKATAMIKNAEMHFGFKLLERRAGGAFGGGSDLTPEARAVMQLYSRFAQDLKSCADIHFDKLSNALQKLKP